MLLKKKNGTLNNTGKVLNQIQVWKEFWKTSLQRMPGLATCWTFYLLTKCDDLLTHWLMLYDFRKQLPKCLRLIIFTYLHHPEKIKNLLCKYRVEEVWLGRHSCEKGLGNLIVFTLNMSQEPALISSTGQFNLRLNETRKPIKRPAECLVIRSPNSCMVWDFCCHEVSPSIAPVTPETVFST